MTAKKKRMSGKWTARQLTYQAFAKSPAQLAAVRAEHAWEDRLVELYGEQGKSVQRYWPDSRHADAKLKRLGARWQALLVKARAEAQRQGERVAGPVLDRMGGPLKNKPISRARASAPAARNPSAPRGELMSSRVLRVEYIHAADGKRYYHDFKPGVSLRVLPDGSVRIVGAKGQRITREF